MPIHADPHTLVCQQWREVFTRALPALVRIEHLRSPPLTQRLGEGLATKLPVQRDRERPTQYIPPAPVHHRHPRDKPLVETHRGDSGTPDVIDPRDLHAAQPIRVNRLSRGRLTQMRLGIDRFHPHLRHQPRHALMVHLLALCAQLGRHAAHTVKRGRRVLRLEAPHEVECLLTGPSRLIIQTRSRQPQSGTLAPETNLGMVHLDHLTLGINRSVQLLFSTSPPRLCVGRSAGITGPSAPPLLSLDARGDSIRSEVLRPGPLVSTGKSVRDGPPMPMPTRAPSSHPGWRRVPPVLCTRRYAAVSSDSWCVSRPPCRLSLFSGPVFGVHYIDM
jgi:hypothetical protein